MSKNQVSYYRHVVYVRTRRAPSCQLTGAPIEDGTPVIAFQNSKLRKANKVQYILPEAWHREYTPEEAAEVVFGTPAKHGYQFQFGIDVPFVPEPLLVDCITPNGDQGLWRRTEHGIVSPRYCQARWQRRLNLLDAGLRADMLKCDKEERKKYKGQIRIWHEGMYLGSKTLPWSAFVEESGKFAKAFSNAKATRELVQAMKLR